MKMRKACFYTILEHLGLQNIFFLNISEGQGMKNLNFPFIALKNKLFEYGIDLSTRDINPPEDSELIFCLDCPQHLVQTPKKIGQIWCLIIYDPPIYYPESWDVNYHTKFDFVFTFDETIVDNVKYFHYPFAIDTEYFSMPEFINEDLYKKRKLSTFVSNSIHKLKDKKNSGSLIHRRYETIVWFGENHPGDFGFYGGTFKKRDYYIAFKGVSVLKRVLPKKLFYGIAKILQRRLIKVFKGELGPLDKFRVIREYNFYYCFENTENINGYLTEKIFDCFYSGVVPIYWGAPNVAQLIPYKCYINGNDFKDLESLYLYIKHMPYIEYSEYLKQAHVFLNSNEMNKFTVATFVNSILLALKNVLHLDEHVSL